MNNHFKVYEDKFWVKDKVIADLGPQNMAQKRINTSYSTELYLAPLGSWPGQGDLSSKDAAPVH